MKKFPFLLVILFAVFVFCLYVSAEEVKSPRHVVLLGASVGQAWNISALPERIGTQDFVFEYVRGGGFDKTNALKRIVSREENRPDVVFIKECAAYFPGDFERYKNLVKTWVEICQEADVTPILATVVPVTRLHSFKKILIDIVKGRDPFVDGNPFDNNRNKAILDFNDWIRLYAEKEGLAVLDMEDALRYSEMNRFLREDFAKLDGLHVNTKGFVNLDRIVIPTLKNVRWENQNN
jgi:lysophospholipase L1-like esterase